MLSRVLFEKYIYILTLKMASPSGNQHYASCIGTLSFPVLHMEPEAICVRVVRPSVRTSVPGRKHSLTGLPSTSSFSCLIGQPLQPVTVKSCCGVRSFHVIMYSSFFTDDKANSASVPVLH